MQANCSDPDFKLVKEPEFIGKAIWALLQNMVFKCGLLRETSNNHQPSPCALEDYQDFIQHCSDPKWQSLRRKTVSLLCK